MSLIKNAFRLESANREAIGIMRGSAVMRNTTALARVFVVGLCGLTATQAVADNINTTSNVAPGGSLTTTDATTNVIGTGSLIFLGNATVDVDSDNNDAVDRFTITSDATVNASSGVVTVNADETRAWGTLNVGAAGQFISDLRVVGGGEANIAGTLTGDVDNDGLLDVDGLVDGNVDSDGTMELAGDVSGTLDNGGLLTVNGVSVVTGALTNQAGSNMVVNAALTATAGLVNDSVVSADALDLNANLTGDLDNNGNADIDGNIDGNVDNDGTMTLAGDISGTLDNGGDLTVDGASEVTGLATNEAGATMTIDATLTATAGLVNSSSNGANALDLNGTLIGDLTNVGNADIDGNVVGNVGNYTSMTLAGDISGTLDNGGVLTVDGASTVTGLVTNLSGAGTMTVDATLTATAGVVNDNDFTLNGTLIGDLLNTDIADINGNVVGSVDNDSLLTLAGDISGTLENSGFVTVDGASEVTGLITNQAGGNMDVNAVLTATAGLQNDSTTGADALDLNANLIGDLDNNGNADVDANIDGNVDNDGTMTLAGDVSGTLDNAGTLTVDGVSTITGLATNEAGGTMDVNAVLTASAGLQNDSTTGADALDLNANLIGNLDNNGNADVDANITGNVDNDGTLLLAGDVSGTLDNGGDTTIDGVSTVTGLVTNEVGGTMDVNAVLTASAGLQNDSTTGADALDLNANLIGNLDNNGNADVDANITGNVDNDGTLLLAGDVSGTLDNGGDTTIDGASTVTGLVTNEAGGTMSIDAALTATAGVQNDSTTGADALHVNAALIGDLDNNGNADVDAAITGNVDNDGTLLLGSNITGALLNGATVTVDGASVVTGAVINEATGTMGVDAATSFTFASLTNDGTLSTGAGSTLGGGLLTNNATMNVGDGTNVTTGFVNTATLNIADNAAFQGGFTSTGLIDMSGGTPDGQVVVTGPAALGGTLFEMDADMSGVTNLADNFTVSGVATGAVTVNFTNSGTGLGTTTAMEILSFGAGSSVVASATGLSNSGLVVSSFTQVGDDWYLNVGINPAIAGIFSGVALTQSLVGSVVNRPSSPFVAGLAIQDEDDPCGPGVWGRAVGGQADVQGSFRTTTLGLHEGLPVSANYRGLQAGADYSCFGGYYNGWDLSFGGIVGVNEGNTAQSVFLFDTSTGQFNPNIVTSINNTSFTQGYAGAYVTAAKGDFQGDLQLRYEYTDFAISEVAQAPHLPLGLDTQTFNSNAITLSGSLSKVFRLNEEKGIIVVPVVGFSYSSINTDDVTFLSASTPGVLQIDRSQVAVGYVGATIARSKVLPDQRSALTYFATATVYSDFAPDARTVFVPTVGASDEAFSSNLGTYGEISLGLNYTRILGQSNSSAAAKQLNASLRVDGRFGESISSWGVTGQFRLQF